MQFRQNAPGLSDPGPDPILWSALGRAPSSDHGCAPRQNHRTRHGWDARRAAGCTARPRATGERAWVGGRQRAAGSGMAASGNFVAGSDSSPASAALNWARPRPENRRTSPVAKWSGWRRLTTDSRRWALAMGTSPHAPKPTATVIVTIGADIGKVSYGREPGRRSLRGRLRNKHRLGSQFGPEMLLSAREALSPDLGRRFCAG